jgi:beta-lactamase class A
VSSVAHGPEDVVARVRAELAAAGGRGHVWAREVGGGPEVALDADAVVPVASVVKVAVAVAYARAVDAGLDPRERVEVPARLRLGGTGTAGCVDPVVASLRDLAVWMMSVSDNAATDVLLDRLGPDAVATVLRDLGLRSTVLRADMTTGALGVAAELGLPDAHDLDAQLGRLVAAGGEERVRGLGWLDPERANCSTARDVGALLDAVWTDRAGSPAACSLVRGLLQHQVSAQRLRSGFPGDLVQVASKTGTLPGLRHEAGVVTLPDGRSVVVVLLVRSRSLVDHDPGLDAAIGRGARLLVDALAPPADGDARPDR